MDPRSVNKTISGGRGLGVSKSKSSLNVEILKAMFLNFDLINCTKVFAYIKLPKVKVGNLLCKIVL